MKWCWRKFCWCAVIASTLIGLKLFGVALLISVFGLVGYFPYQSYTDRYDHLDLLPGSEEPSFRAVSLPFTHQYTADDALPFLASAIIDMDNDGVEEVFLGGGTNQPDSLWAYKEDSFTEISSTAGLGETVQEPSLGAVVLDLDNNGWDDLFVARNSGVWWYKNIAGKFTIEKLDLELTEKENIVSLAFGDIDKDGDADLFTANYVDRDFVEGQSVFNDSNYGGQSRMFLNNGDSTFTNITALAGLDYVHNTFQAMFVDINADTNQDLVVVYDTGHIKTWRNNGDLTFTDMPNPTHDWFGYPMGLGMSDYDNDGDPDFMFSNIGELAVMTPVVKGDLRADQRYHKKLILLRNDGNFKFTDVAESAEIADYEFSWGIVSEDFNNDSLADLVIAQNYVDLPQHKLFPLPGRFLLQTAGGKFTNREIEAGVENRYFGIAPLVADFNQDGALDLVYANLNGESKAFINQGLKSHFVRVKLPSKASSLGAKVTLHLEGKLPQTAWYSPSEGLGSDSSHIVHFGVGTEVKPATLKIEYLNGETKKLEKVIFDTTLTLQ